MWRLVERYVSWRSIVFCTGMAFTGCGGPIESRYGLNSPDALGRVQAIRAAGEARDESAVPLLVNRLEDEEQAVRFYAILALERITGHRFGFDYGDPAAKRAKAVERWRQYIAQGRHAAPSDSDNRAAAGSGPVDGRNGDAGAREPLASETAPAMEMNRP